MRCLSRHSVYSAICVVCDSSVRSFLLIVVVLSYPDLVHNNSLIRFNTRRYAIAFHGTWISLNELWIMVLNLIPCRLIRRIIIRDKLVWSSWWLRNASLATIIIIFHNFGWIWVQTTIHDRWIILVPRVLMLIELWILMNPFWDEWGHLSCSELFWNIIVVWNCS